MDRPLERYCGLVGQVCALKESWECFGLLNCFFFRLSRNVPGVALYMTSLTQLRTIMAKSPYFGLVRKNSSRDTLKNASVLPSLTIQGNLLAGATTRVGVGFLLNPFSVLKARFEVRSLLPHQFEGLTPVHLLFPSIAHVILLTSMALFSLRK